MSSIKGIEFKVGTQKKIFSQSVTNEVILPIISFHNALCIGFDPINLHCLFTKLIFNYIVEE